VPSEGAAPQPGAPAAHVSGLQAEPTAVGLPQLAVSTPKGLPLQRLESRSPVSPALRARKRLRFDDCTGPNAQATPATEDVEGDGGGDGSANNNNAAG
jgi:hypothetical protein